MSPFSSPVGAWGRRPRGPERAPATNDAVKKQLLPILGLALVVRVVVAGFTNCVGSNGAIFFLPVARALARGDLDGGLSTVVPPLYYALVAAASFVVPGDVDLAGQVVSVLSGLGAVALSWALARAFFGAADGRVPAVAALFAAIAPYLVRYSGEAQEDMLFGCAMAAAALAGWRLLRGGGLLAAAATGGLVALAYEARPEAMGLGGLVGLALLLGVGVRGRTDGASDATDGAADATAPGAEPGKPAFSRRAVLGVVVALAFLVGALPNILVLRKKLGFWTLSAKAGMIMKYGHPQGEDPFNRRDEGAIETVHERAYSGKDAEALAFDPMEVIGKDPLGFAKGWAGYVAEMLGSLPEAAGVWFLLIVGGVIAAARAGDERTRFAGRAAIVVILFYVASLSFFYTSRRFWAHYLPMYAPFAGLAVVWLADAIARRRGWDARRVLLVSCAALTAATLPQTLRPIPKYGWCWRVGPEVEAGRFLAEQVAADRVDEAGAPRKVWVLGTRGYVPLYADCAFQRAPTSGPAETRREVIRGVIEQKKIDYYVASDRDRRTRLAPFEACLREGELEPLARFGEGFDRDRRAITVFRIRLREP